MDLIERKFCVISGKNDLEHLYSFEKFPVFMGCVNHGLETDISEDMIWSISRNSGLIQLKKLLPLEVLYPESHGAGVLSGLWKKHHNEFANFLYKTSPTSVFELGGAHGILAAEFEQLVAIPWTILEPNPSPVEGCKADFIKGFFDDKFRFSEPFDTVVHSHVLEHIYDPDQFMKYLSEFMENGKNLVFSIPNLQIWLEQKYTTCINFEHTIFLTEPYVDFLLAKYGFRLISKQYFLDDHSIFYATVRDRSVMPINLPNDLYKKNKQLYLDFITYHEKLIYDLNKKIRGLNHQIYLFGAHIFSQYLISFGLDTTHIMAVLDNDPQKQGKRLYGTNLLVHSPYILKDIKQPVVILKAGIYNHEIKEDILKNINSDTAFFE